jgi:hypothetical protein
LLRAAVAAIVGTALGLVLSSTLASHPAALLPCAPIQTPAAKAPVAPTSLRWQQGADTRTLIWDDNSDNEDGFMICVSPGDFRAVVPADVASYALPDGWPINCELGLGVANYSARAFNGAGVSAPAGFSIAALCAVESPTTPTPTAQAPGGLPPTGTGLEGSGAIAYVLLPALVALASACLVSLAVVGTRTNRK